MICETCSEDRGFQFSQQEELETPNKIDMVFLKKKQNCYYSLLTCSVTKFAHIERTIVITVTKKFQRTTVITVKQKSVLN